MTCGRMRITDEKFLTKQFEKKYSVYVIRTRRRSADREGGRKRYDKTTRN